MVARFLDSSWKIITGTAIHFNLDIIKNSNLEVGVRFQSAFKKTRAAPLKKNYDDDDDVVVIGS